MYGPCLQSNPNRFVLLTWYLIQTFSDNMGFIKLSSKNLHFLFFGKFLDIPFMAYARMSPYLHCNLSYICWFDMKIYWCQENELCYHCKWMKCILSLLLMLYLLYLYDTTNARSMSIFFFPWKYTLLNCDVLQLITWWSHSLVFWPLLSSLDAMVMLYTCG